MGKDYENMGRIAMMAIILCVLTLLAPMVMMDGGTAALGEAPEQEASKQEVGYTVISGTEDEVHEKVIEEEATVDSKITIPVLIDGSVQYLKLDEYLTGVVAAEMPASFPEEALKAQAVAARTYIIHKRWLVESGETIDPMHKGAIMCDDHTHCSAYTDLSVNAGAVFGDNADSYIEKITSAVHDTDGIIMEYNGEPISAAFHAISGGRTESAADVWGSDVPYLQNVESIEDETAAMYTSEVTYAVDEVKSLMESQLPSADLSVPVEEWFKDIVRSEAGGIMTISVGGVQVKGTWLRSVLSLASTDFTVEVEDDDITFRCTGYGHGVGMSQYGAKRMADNGDDYSEILTHYYTGVELRKLEK